MTTLNDGPTTSIRLAAQMGKILREEVEVGCLTAQTEPLAAILESRIIGQERVTDALTCAFPRVLAGLRDPRRPVLSLLLLGPTGVGKTETAKAIAQTLFGSENAMTRVNCEEYAHGHELSKLLGAPPGYVGHNVEPLLSQRRIDQHHLAALAEKRGMAGEGALEATFPAGDGAFLSVVLFDEIEKAHPVLWNAMLGILEEGAVTLGDNSNTDFTRSIVVMTSNIGSREMNALVERRPVGFSSAKVVRAPRLDLQQAALSAAREMFPLEFLNRFDDTIVFSPLDPKHLGLIFEKFLADIHARAVHRAGVPLLIKVSAAAKSLILDKGTNLAFGARPLRRAMETELVDPLSRLIASQRVKPGDVVEVDRRGDRLVFYRRHGDSDLVA